MNFIELKGAGAFSSTKVKKILSENNFLNELDFEKPLSIQYSNKNNTCMKRRFLTVIDNASENLNTKENSRVFFCIVVCLILVVVFS